MRVAELPVAGLHNAANAMAALALCGAIGIKIHPLLQALRNFRGLRHRVEKVAEIAGVTYFDDSKGTNVGATLAAINGLGGAGSKVVIILGGEGKGQDFSPLKAALGMYGRAVVLIGRDAETIAAAIEGAGVVMQRCSDMEKAVRWCAAQAQAGDVVLLSPACASLDMYRNYAQRGDVFAAAVAALKGESV